MTKNSLKSFYQSILTLSCAAFLISCSFAEPPNLTVLKKELTTYHDSGAYEKELTQVIMDAQNYILKQAELNEKANHKEKLAIVLDIDETSLSNYRRMEKRSFGGNRTEFHKDILAADAPAIEPTLNLFKTAKKHGVKVFFVTGRPLAELSATRKNLIRAGYAHWDGLFLKPNSYNKDTIIPFKAHARATIEKQGYKVIASIGDQYSDIKGGYVKKGFKLPNPYYYLP